MHPSVVVAVKMATSFKIYWYISKIIMECSQDNNLVSLEGYIQGTQDSERIYCVFWKHCQSLLGFGCAASFYDQMTFIIASLGKG